jgi:hypothetical protein
MYRKNRVLTAKIVPTGWGWAWVGWSFRICGKAEKISASACLSTICFIPQVFPHPFRRLSAKLKLLDFQRFENIKQVLVAQRFYACSTGRVDGSRVEG